MNVRILDRTKVNNFFYKVIIIYLVISLIIGISCIVYLLM